jgi:hypothetical protein
MGIRELASGIVYTFEDQIQRHEIAAYRHNDHRKRKPQ